MPDTKPTGAPVPPKPASKDAAKILTEVSKRAQAEQAKKKKTQPPVDELPENWGIGDLVRVGTSRLKRAVYGPEEKK